MRAGSEKIYTEKSNRKLSCGYTTGTCAAAAAQGAAALLLEGTKPEEIRLLTPKGIELRLRPEEYRREGESALCGVRKEAGDDPDVTDGILVCASVRKTGTGSISIEGGDGVGRITQPGLEQPVGAAAINRVPRAMIRREAEAVCERCGYKGGLAVTISIPGGEEIAVRTFNPRLGIEGGLSILGTTGIEEPYSESAILGTIEAEMKLRAARGWHTLPVTPGNYGADYLRGHLQMDLDRAVRCSNYIGETIDRAVSLGFEGILLVGHIGKLVKVAGGIMNTHSREADCRMEILAAAGIRAGCDAAAARAVLSCVSTDAALAVLEEAHVLREAMRSLTEKIAAACDRRAYGRLQFGILLFSRERGELGRTENFSQMLDACRREEEEG